MCSTVNLLTHAALTTMNVALMVYMGAVYLGRPKFPVGHIRIGNLKASEVESVSARHMVLLLQSSRHL